MEATEIPDPWKILKVMEIKFTNLQASQQSHASSSKPKVIANAVNATHNNKSSNNNSCLFCKKTNHNTISCKIFHNKGSMGEKWAMVKNNIICANCLMAEKGKCKCWETKISKCRQCKMLHHNCLHNKDWKPKPREAVTNAHVQVTVEEKKMPLIPTAMLRIQKSNGDHMLIRAFLDTGATHSFITEKCAQSVDNKIRSVNVSAKTYCGGKGAPISGSMGCLVTPHFPSTFQMNFSAYVTKTLGDELPSETVYAETDPSRWELQLADNEWDTPEIDMILGAPEVARIIKPNIFPIDNISNMVVMETQLGYVCFGRATKRHEKTVQTDQDGYTVRIPCKLDNELGESKRMTIARVCRNVSICVNMCYCFKVDEQGNGNLIS